ncbi:hypothetical protein BDV96DRAFT_629286, partial [Lophiotrema nucula]
MHHHGWRQGAGSLHASTIILLLPPLIIAFPLSLLVLVVHEIAIGILRSHTSRGTLILPAESLHSSTTVAINKLPSDFIIGTSIATALLSTIAALGIWELRKRDVSSARHQRIWGWANIFVVLANLGLVTACTVLVFLAQRDDDRQHISVRYLDENDAKKWTRETWLCQIKKVNGFGSWPDIGCGFAVASRWMLIPLGACSLLMAVLCLWQVL